MLPIKLVDAPRDTPTTSSWWIAVGGDRAAFQERVRAETRRMQESRFARSS